MSIIPLLTAVILNFGMMGLLGVELSHLTALLTAVIIGVGVDFSIHYISEYKNHKKTIDLDILSKETIDSVVDLLSATGHTFLNELNRYDINRRIDHMNVKRFDEIYPIIKTSSFINGEIPNNLKQAFDLANKNSFIPSL